MVKKVDTFYEPSAFHYLPRHFEFGLDNKFELVLDANSSCIEHFVGRIVCPRCRNKVHFDRDVLIALLRTKSTSQHAEAAK